MTPRRIAVGLLATTIATTLAAQQGPPPSPTGVPTFRSPTGTVLKLMLDDRNVGGDVTVGEITFPPNSDSGDHAHGAIEMFYVVEGELEHVVNGRSEILKPGMTGFVRPPDKVRHKVGPAGARAIVIWVPGEEGKKIAARWKKEP